MTQPVVWIPGTIFDCPTDQRAWIVATDSERKTVIVRSCSRPDVIAEIPATKIVGVELDGLSFKFREPSIQFR
jgi:hypothetical protein